jgi:hypothetical protein
MPTKAMANWVAFGFCLTVGIGILFVHL